MARRIFCVLIIYSLSIGVLPQLINHLPLSAVITRARGFTPARQNGYNYSGIQQNMLPNAHVPREGEEEVVLQDGSKLPCQNAQGLLKILANVLDILGTNSSNGVASLEKVDKILNLIKSYLDNISHDKQHDDLHIKLKNIESALENAKAIGRSGPETFPNVVNPINRAEAGIVYQYDLPGYTKLSCREAYLNLIALAHNAYMRLANHPHCSEDVASLPIANQIGAVDFNSIYNVNQNSLNNNNLPVSFGNQNAVQSQISPLDNLQLAQSLVNKNEPPFVNQNLPVSLNQNPTPLVNRYPSSLFFRNFANTQSMDSQNRMVNVPPNFASNINQGQNYNVQENVLGQSYNANANVNSNNGLANAPTNHASNLNHGNTYNVKQSSFDVVESKDMFTIPRQGATNDKSPPTVVNNIDGSNPLTLNNAIGSNAINNFNNAANNFQLGQQASVGSQPGPPVPELSEILDSSLPNTPPPPPPQDNFPPANNPPASGGNYVQPNTNMGNPAQNNPFGGNPALEPLIALYAQLNQYMGNQPQSNYLPQNFAQNQALVNPIQQNPYVGYVNPTNPVTYNPMTNRVMNFAQLHQAQALANPLIRKPNIPSIPMNQLNPFGIPSLTNSNIGNSAQLNHVNGNLAQQYPYGNPSVTNPVLAGIPAGQNLFGNPSLTYPVNPANPAQQHPLANPSLTNPVIPVNPVQQNPFPGNFQTNISPGNLAPTNLAGNNYPPQQFPQPNTSNGGTHNTVYLETIKMMNQNAPNYANYYTTVDPIQQIQEKMNTYKKVIEYLNAKNQASGASPYVQQQQQNNAYLQQQQQNQQTLLNQQMYHPMYDPSNMQYPNQLGFGNQQQTPLLMYQQNNQRQFSPKTAEPNQQASAASVSNNLSRQVAGGDYKSNIVARKANQIELTYLLRRPSPLVMQPYYMVKYTVPYEDFLTSMRSAIEKQPYLRSKPFGLYKELALHGNISELSPDLMQFSKESIQKMVTDQGTFYNARLVNEHDANASGLLKGIQVLNANMNFGDVLNRVDVLAAGNYGSEPRSGISSKPVTLRSQPPKATEPSVMTGIPLNTNTNAPVNTDDLKNKLRALYENLMSAQTHTQHINEAIPPESHVLINNKAEANQALPPQNDILNLSNINGDVQLPKNYKTSESPSMFHDQTRVDIPYYGSALG